MENNQFNQPHVVRDSLFIHVNSMDKLNELLSEARTQMNKLQRTINEISDYKIEIKFNDSNSTSD